MADTNSSLDGSEGQNLTKEAQIEHALAQNRVVSFVDGHLDGRVHDAVVKVATEFQIRKHEREAARNWDIFYKRNTTNFFKDRHWTDTEFLELKMGLPSASASASPAQGGNGDGDSEGLRASGSASSGSTSVLTLGGDVLVPRDTGDRMFILELGCGVGNTIYPLLEKYPNLAAHACDFSPRAVDFVKSHPLYTPERVHAFVHDLTCDEPSLLSKVSSTDAFSTVAHLSTPPSPALPVLATAFFVLSAISPNHHLPVLRSIATTLQPGGHLLFRDYAYGDLAQLRFHSPTRPSKGYGTPSLLSDAKPLYRRGDGTMTYFFKEEEVKGWVEEADVDITETRHDNEGKVDGERSDEGQRRGGGGGVETTRRVSELELVSLETVRRTVENRKEGIVMERAFIQAKFRKRLVNAVR